MNIGILGASTVGTALAQQFASVGHKVLVANSRGPESLRSKLADVDIRLTASSTAEVLNCDVIFLAVPWFKVKEALTPEHNWYGRILVDTTNIFLSYAPNFEIDDLNGSSGSEIVSKLASSARTVKAFNTLPFEKTFAPHDPAVRRVLFIAGDDASAVQVVEQLIDEIGLYPVALGSLATAGRMMELNGPLSGLELFKPLA